MNLAATRSSGWPSSFTFSACAEPEIFGSAASPVRRHPYAPPRPGCNSTGHWAGGCAPSARSTGIASFKFLDTRWQREIFAQCSRQIGVRGTNIHLRIAEPQLAGALIVIDRERARTGMPPSPGLGPASRWPYSREPDGVACAVHLHRTAERYR